MNKAALEQALATALQENDFEQLEQLARQAVSDYPEEAFSYAYLAEALLSELPIPFDKVELCLAKASELDPSNTQYLARFATIKSMQGEEDAAQLIWGKILHLDPEYVQALTAKAAHQLTQNRDYERALELLNRALEQEEQATTLLYRAQVFNHTGQYAEALSDVERANSLEPEFDSQVAYLTIDIYKNLDQLEKALPLYEQLLEQEEEDSALLYEYALLLIKLEQEEKALPLLVKAAELTEHKDDTLEFLLGETAMMLGEYDLATTAFQHCIAANPELTEAAFLLVEILIQQEQYQEALTATQNLKKDLEDPTQQDRAQILEARALAGLGKDKKAEDLLVPVAKKQGLHQADAYFELGVLYHKQGDAPKAYRFIKAAAVQEHELAEQYLKTELSEVLTKLRTATLEANKGAFAKNERSKFLNQLFGKLWVFDNLKSERLEDFDPSQLDNIKQALASSSLVIDKKGVLMLSKQREQMATYKIQKETASGALLEFLPLDGFKGFTAKLQLAGDGNTLVFSKEKGEAMLYKAQVPVEANPSVKEAYQENISREDAQYLGDQATAVVEQLL